MTDLPTSNLVMLTHLYAEGQLEVYFEHLPIPEPKPHEILVKVLAAPINPSDIILLFGGADLETARATTRNGLPSITADISPAGMRALASRVGEALPIGNESSGLVVAAGDSPAAQALVGKTVAILGGEMYAEYRCLPVQAALPLPDGTDPVDGASCFVNPLTSLAFTETMRLEGHSAIIHTAAASNLGQMLVKICAKDGIPLVNIVRSDGQAELLKGLGAEFVVNSSDSDFRDRLVDAATETGATLAFDAIGGGKMGGQILAAMEVAAVKRMTAYSRYGSDTFKQLYIYGVLDKSPTEFNRSFGFSWAMGGFLLTPFMTRVGPDVIARMRQRVVDELTTTFKSHYSHQISLVDALNLDIARAYNVKRTGEKYLIRPHG